MQYWLKVTGTTERPMEADWHRRFERWNVDRGQVSAFPRRPRVKVGDRLVYYAAGSPALFGAGRIYAVVEATGGPEPGSDDRWSWQVPVVVLIEGPLLPDCPTLGDIGVDAKSVRRQSHIRLSEDQGSLAEQLIARAGRR